VRFKLNGIFCGFQFGLVRFLVFGLDWFGLRFCFWFGSDMITPSDNCIDYENDMSNLSIQKCKPFAIESNLLLIKFLLLNYHYLPRHGHLMIVAVFFLPPLYVMVVVSGLAPYPRAHLVIMSLCISLNQILVLNILKL
jgi:hypothetical protein